MLDDDMMHTRSRLYNLEPIGIGTGDVESITSYVVRLAEAHKVPVRKILDGIDTLGIPFLPFLSNAVNGFGDRTNTLITHLEHATLRNDLSSLVRVSGSGVNSTARS